MSEETEPVARGRIVLGALGLMGGLAAWSLAHVLPERLGEWPRLHLFVSGLAWAFFSAALALAGPVRLKRALAAALVLALPLAALLTWASLRFDGVAEYLASGRAWAGFALLLCMALPFALAGLGRGTRWSDYAALFTQSWLLVVRVAAAWLFVGLVWAVLFLSNALLELVGIDLIERLYDLRPVPYLLSGLTFGIALAVVGELSDYVSPDLLLRLLRLLLPPVLVVVAVFLAAIPFRGLATLFGAFSAAGTLLAMAFGAATLISTGLDSGAEARAPGRVTLWSCRLMALLLPALAALGLLAIRLRVGQYGLTPDRVIAETLALLALGYGLAYAGAVLAGAGWENRIRRANVAMALIVMASVASLFTPLLNPERIAARNQVARFEAGRIGAEGLDLWTLAHEWGRPGRAAIARLAALGDGPGAERLAERLAALDQSDSRQAFERAEESDDIAALRADLERSLPVRPEGAALPAGFLDSLRLWELRQVAQACRDRTEGDNPGCVALVADLSGLNAGNEILIVARTLSGAPLVRAYFPDGDGAGWAMRSPDYLRGPALTGDADAAIDALIAGEYRIAPVTLNAVDVAGRSLFFGR